MRALSDDLDLAETTGIDTSRVILYTWIFSGSLAGLAGVLAGANLALQPELGFTLLLAIFAAVILGGHRRRRSAPSPGGMVLGLVTEWSTMFIDSRLEAGGRVRRPDPGPDHPPAGHLRQGEGGLGRVRAHRPAHPPAVRDRLELAHLAPCSWSTSASSPGIYALLALGLQLNVGFTGITNFGQAGFMAVGGYTMAILTVDTGISFWLSLPLSMLAAMAFGLLVGLPSLRLRADYFAIATLASAEVVRIIAQNAQGLTGGNQGFFCNDDFSKCFDDTWNDVSNTIVGWLQDLGWSDPEALDAAAARRGRSPC